jgi:hypothetical protein
MEGLWGNALDEKPKRRRRLCDDDDDLLILHDDDDGDDDDDNDDGCPPQIRPKRLYPGLAMNYWKKRMREKGRPGRRFPKHLKVLSITASDSVPHRKAVQVKSGGGQ